MATELYLTKGYRLTTAIEVSQYTVLQRDGSVFVDGAVNPSGANVEPAGVATEAIIPSGLASYSGGVYGIVTGTAWPANSIPAGRTGRGISLAVGGIIRCKAAGVIAVGNRVNIADTQGRVKAVSEALGTLIWQVGIAQDAATAAGDIIRVLLTIGTNFPHE